MVLLVKSKYDHDQCLKKKYFDCECKFKLNSTHDCYYGILLRMRRARP